MYGDGFPPFWINQPSCFFLLTVKEWVSSMGTEIFICVIVFALNVPPGEK